MILSIITVCYNSSKYIAQTFESILRQTYDKIEYIVIDGKSTDGTIDIIRKYEPLFEGKMKWVSEKDNGIYDAMNKGIELATGDIIGILNSDDFYIYEDVISDIVKQFTVYQCSAVYGDLLYVNSLNTNKINRYWKAGSFKINTFKWGWMPPHPTFFVKREIYEQYGKFNTTLTSAADYEFILRVLYKEKIKVSYLPKIIIKMRVGGKSNISLKNRIKGNKEDRLAWKVNHIKPYFFTLYIKPLRKIFQYLLRP